MNYRAVGYAVSLLLLIVCTAISSCVLVSWWMKDPLPVILHFAGTAFATFVISLTGIIVCRKKGREPELKTGARDGFAAVGLAWLAAVVVCAGPFINVMGMSFADSIFESASGLTTTGGTVLVPDLILRSGEHLGKKLEELPAGILYWRSLMNWLGGAGIVLFVLLIQPLMSYSGSVGNSLFNAESTGLKTSSDKVTPRLVSSTRIIFLVYLLLTGLAAGIFFIGGMNLFEAVCHSFSTVSTGGFSPRSSSMADFSAFIQWSAVVFMMLSACNFTLTVKMFMTRRIWYFKDEEFKFFFAVAAIASIVIAAGLYMKTHLVEHSLRESVFQVVSLMTTTGFTTSDYTKWSVSAAPVILFLLMFPCGCAGSTSGGMKCVRILIVLKQAYAELRHCIFPRSLTAVRLNGERLESSVVSKTMAFMFTYILLFLAAATILPIICPMDMTTAFSASLSSISNIGPGFGGIGPGSSYAWMNGPAKILLAFLMVAGRLELYTCLLFFLPSFWKK